MAVKLENKEQSARAFNIHKLLGVELVRIKEVIRRHANYTFMGYITVKFVGRAGTPLEGFVFFQKFEAKILKYGFHLETPQEKGNDGGWYSDSCFGSRETRAVITRQVEELPEVQAWLKAAATPESTETPASDEGDDNPYVG